MKVFIFQFSPWKRNIQQKENLPPIDSIQILSFEHFYVSYLSLKSPCFFLSRSLCLPVVENGYSSVDIHVTSCS